MNQAKVGDFPWDPSKPVHTFWDIGIGDATAIWFLQQCGGPGSAINVIDYEESSNVPLFKWAGIVNEKPYTYGEHWGPHDIRKRDFGTGKSHISVALEFGIDFNICPGPQEVSQKAGIDAVKGFVPRLQFNRDTTQRGHDALTNYRREYNDKLKIFMDRPLHDWASNGADAMRVAAICFPENYGSNFVHNFKVKRALG
jgi:hypothetical protein